LIDVLIACAATTGNVNEFLDERTGVTVTSSIAPFVLYRDNPSQAAYARNLLHIGPIEVNRSGSYQYFLWVGIWNTMDTADSATQRDSFDSITIFADGEPLPLEIAGWTPDAIGASRHVYLRPVASAAEAYYRVTVDQIRLIAEASDLRIRTSATSPREYQLWDNQQAARKDFEAFLSAAFF
jgi:hypothetical protein